MPPEQQQALGIVFLIVLAIGVIALLASLAPKPAPSGLDFAPPVHHRVSLAKALATGAPDPCPGSTPIAANEAYGSVYIVCADGVTARP